MCKARVPVVRRGRYLILVMMLSLLAVAGRPWQPWAPTHDPPYTCAELLDMTAYGEWSHQWWASNGVLVGGVTKNGWTRDEELRWVFFYQRIRPMIKAGCRDEVAPAAAPEPAWESPLP